MKTGELERAILRLKDGYWAWGIIFARVVLGYLYENPDVVRHIDAIIPTPAFIGNADRRHADHAGWVIEQAIEQDETGLPMHLEPPLIVKTRATRRMRYTSSAVQRREAAAELLAALEVPDQSRVQDKQIMVYDDVFTGGNTLNAVATRLREAGAIAVYGLTLARQPWR